MEQKGGWEGSKLHFFVTIDGSDASHLAFEAVTDTLLHPSDQLTVAHIYDDKKEFLAFDMKPQALRQKYEQLTLLMGPKASLAWNKVKDGKTTKEQMVDIAEEYNAGVLVIGLHGRKGPKE